MRHWIFTILILLMGTLVYGQPPEGFTYQAVARDGSGEILADQNVGLRISILQGSISGFSVYAETHTATSNSFGLINLEIGDGTTSDSFSAIDWSSGPYFIKVEMDAAGGTSYTEFGTSQLLSVPYAMHAKTAENTFSGDYSDLMGIPSIPSNLSELNNDSGFITDPADTDSDPTNEIQDISLVGAELSITDGSTVDLSGLPGGGSETDPEVGANTLNYLSKWDGSALISSDIFDNGNIGIGTMDPATKLHVVHSGPALTIRSENLDPSGHASIGVKNDIGRFFNWSLGGSSDVYPSAFYLWDSEIGGPRLLVNDIGIGIGTTSPDHLLSVAGMIESTIDGYKFPDGTVQSTAATGGSYWQQTGDDISYNLGRVNIGTTIGDHQLVLQDVFTAGGKNLMVGDDAYLTDIDQPGILGIYGEPDNTRGAIRLGSSGIELHGKNARLGVGTNNPVELLHLVSDFVPNIKVDGPDNSGYYIGYNALGYMAFSTRYMGTPYLETLNLRQGKVGIGTTNILPYGRMQIVGDLILENDGSSPVTSLWVNQNGAGPSRLAYGIDTTPGNWRWVLIDGTGTEFLNVSSVSGNVGIGMNDPSERLSVFGIIESTVGGIKFPDGTVQTSAASGDPLDEIQDLQIDGDLLSITNNPVATPIDLGVYKLESDDQQLSYDDMNRILTLEDGGPPIDLSDLSGVADGSVTTEKIQDLAVIEGKISSGAITESKLATGAVSGGKIQGNAITNSHIANSQITSDKLVDLTITGSKIAENTINASKLQDQSIPSGKLAPNSVNTEELVDGAVTSAKIADSQITTLKISGGAIITDKIADAQVTLSKLAANAVDSDRITPGAVTLGKLAANSVQTDNIIDLVVTNSKLAENSVDTRVLVANSVTSGHIMPDAVRTTEILDGAVTNVKLAPNIGVWSRQDNNIFYNDGKVGIGTSTPNQMLHIVSGTDPNIRVDAPGNSGYYIGFNGAGYMAFSTVHGGTPYLDVMNLKEGKVGIGVNNPSEQLEVDGIIKATAFMGDGSGLTGISANSLGAPDGDPAEVVHIDNDGRVGIGNIAPVASLNLSVPSLNTEPGFQIDMPDFEDQVNNDIMLLTSEWAPEGIGRMPIMRVYDDEAAAFIELSRGNYQHFTSLSPGKLYLQGDGGFDIHFNWEEGFIYGSIAAGFDLTMNSVNPLLARKYTGSWEERINMTYDDATFNVPVEVNNDLHVTGDLQVDGAISSILPAGIIVPFAGDSGSIPAGWLLCDGSEVSRATYAGLFATVGTNYGSGDNSTTFHVPDFRGRFMRGVDYGTGNDPDAASRGQSNPGSNVGDNVGSLQSDQFKMHDHRLQSQSSSNFSSGPMNIVRSGAGPVITSPAGGNETRPINVSVNYIIKY